MRVRPLDEAVLDGLRVVVGDDEDGGVRATLQGTDGRVLHAAENSCIEYALDDLNELVLLHGYEIGRGP